MHAERLNFNNNKDKKLTMSSDLFFLNNNKDKSIILILIKRRIL